MIIVVVTMYCSKVVLQIFTSAKAEVMWSGYAWSYVKFCAQSEGDFI